MLGFFFLQGKDHELATLKQHIHILEQEHLHKISRIAELETHLHLLMVSVHFFASTRPSSPIDFELYSLNLS